MKSDNYNKIAHDHGYKKMNSYELLDAYLDKLIRARGSSNA